MDTRFLLDHNGLRAGWHQLAAWAGPEVQAYEMDECGRAILNERPSARRQIAFTDVFCQITEQLGHLAVMSAPVVTSSFGIRMPDVVWMPPERWHSFDRDDPVPFVPDLCIEVVVDSDRQRDISRRIQAYLDGGAHEVIVVDRFGRPEFWNVSGRQAASVFGITLTLERTCFEENGNASGIQCSTTDEVSGLAVAGRMGAGNREMTGAGTNSSAKSST